MSQRQRSEKLEYDMTREYKSKTKQGLNNNPLAPLTITLSLALLLLLPPFAHSASDTKRLPNNFPPTYAQLEFDEFVSIKNLEDLLEKRRFRVEMIVFTRSDQSRLGEEPLLFIEPRTVPKSIFALTHRLSETQGSLYAKMNRYCIGYPIIATEPPLPEKLRALLNKENEPELSQWYDEGILQTGLTTIPESFDSKLGEDFSSLPENSLAIETIHSETLMEGTLGAFEQRQNEFSTTDEVLGNADFEIEALEPAIELVIPSNMPSIIPSPYLNFISQLSLFENDVKQGSYRAIPPEDFELDEEASILDRNPKFNLVLHESWQQVVPPRAAPQQIYVAANNPANSLQGLISVTLGRYLHFTGKLWLEAPVEDYEAEQLLRSGDATKTTPQSDLEQMLVQVESFTEVLNEGTLSDLARPDLVAAPKTAYFELNESRRMRSKELHYLDHPAMGIIVKITPVEATLELVTAWADLEEYRKADEQAQ